MRRGTVKPRLAAASPYPLAYRRQVREAQRQWAGRVHGNRAQRLAVRPNLFVCSRSVGHYEADFDFFARGGPGELLN